MNAMNPYRQKQNRHRWQQAGAAIVATATLSISTPTRATIPEQTHINDILGNTSELLIRRSEQREPAQIGSILQQVRDALITAPPNNAYAVLRFLSADGEDLNMFVQTNPHPESAIYYFPCEVKGGDYLIGWGLERNASRGCENGMEVTRGRSSNARLPSPLLAQVLKSTLKSPLAPISQGRSRQVFFCSAVGNSSNMGFATASGDPCGEALQQCQAGGGGCEVATTGFWWTREEQLEATLECGGSPALSIAGTGEAMESQIQTLLQENPDLACSVQVYRPQDFIIFPAPDDVVLAQGDNEILVQTRDTGTDLQVDVLKGAINVRSSDRPEPTLVTQGERYIRSNSGDEAIAYTGEVTTFDREEAITSIDMEVLCAFASYPENLLNVSACNEANLLPNPIASDPSVTVHSSVAFCNIEQGSGSSQGDRRTLQMSSNRGEIKLDYEMYGVPDRVQIIYEGREILDTGFISGRNSLSIPYEGRSGRMEVILTGNENTGTRWNYKLLCP